jgi:hypothetical protein
MEPYDREHWEQLLATVIERVGIERFLDHVVYALERQGHDVLAHQINGLRLLQLPYKPPSQALLDILADRINLIDTLGDVLGDAPPGDPHG